MGEVIFALFFLMALAIFCVGFVESFAEGKKTLAKELEQKKGSVRTIFPTLGIGVDYTEVVNRLADCELISAPNLVSEVLLPNGITRRVYIWHLDWEYVVSKSSGVGVMPIHTSTLNTGGNGMSFNNGTATSFSSGQTTRKAFIQMIFEDNKLVAKEQQGLYE